MNKKIDNSTKDLELANAFIDKHFARIIDWAVGDIKKCCQLRDDGTCDNNGALVGAFILWCCAIDYFGGLYTNNASNGGTKARIKTFINKYMSKYDSDKVYDLRWSLLHYYSPHHFVLYHENNLDANKTIHLSQKKEGIMLHLGHSVLDLEKAVEEYRKELESDDKLKLNLWNYYKEQYPIMPVKVEEIIKPSTFTSLATGTSIIQPLSASGTTSPKEWI